jgi:hypothetical protein
MSFPDSATLHPGYVLHQGYVLHLGFGGGFV